MEALDVVEMATVDGWMCPNVVQTDGAATVGRTSSCGEVEASNLSEHGRTCVGRWRPVAVRERGVGRVRARSVGVSE
jgi:hypothetical protein